MSYPYSLSNNNNNNNHEEDVYDADTIVPDEVPSSFVSLPSLKANVTNDHQLRLLTEMIAISQSSSHSQLTNTVPYYKMRWMSKFEELRAYKELHGHTIVPKSSNPQLSEWVKTQRFYYAALKENKYSPMTYERIQLLDSIGFQWSLPRSVIRETEWHKKFAELCAYKELHGSATVPRSDKSPLFRWTSQQRAEYKKLKSNKPSLMTNERIRMLESIGFVWVLPYGFQMKQAKWNEKFVELQNFKESYGHTNVKKSHKNYRQLHNWVTAQRTEYKMMKENLRTYMTAERVQLLESIGFRWARK